MDWIKLVLATYRLTRLITKDDLPYDAGSLMRKKVNKNAYKSVHHKTLADAIGCKYCFGVWAGLIVVALHRSKRLKWIVDILAISGGQYLIETVSDYYGVDE